MYDIDDVLEILHRIKTAYPDLRLGQIIAGALGPPYDPFYITDDALEAKDHRV